MDDKQECAHVLQDEIYSKDVCQLDFGTRRVRNKKSHRSLCCIHKNLTQIRNCNTLLSRIHKCQ